MKYPMPMARGIKPNAAAAQAALAAAYAWRSGRPMFDAAEEMTKMRLAAEKAIQLDPLSAEAYDALGILYARQAEWEWEGVHTAKRRNPASR